MEEKKEKEVRKMPENIKEFYDDVLRVDAYAEACKSRFFIRTKTIVEAIYKREQMYARFWEKVRLEWPETVKASCLGIYKDKRIWIEW